MELCKGPFQQGWNVLIKLQILPAGWWGASLCWGTGLGELYAHVGTWCMGYLAGMENSWEMKGWKATKFCQMQKVNEQKEIQNYSFSLSLSLLPLRTSVISKLTTLSFFLVLDVFVSLHLLLGFVMLSTSKSGTPNQMFLLKAVSLQIGRVNLVSSLKVQNVLACS